MKRIIELEEEIKKHNKFYWEDNNPQISDEDFDKLTQELKLLDPNNPLLSKVSGSIINSSNKVKHATAMLSLDKVYSWSELILWIDKVSRDIDEKFVFQPKYDGWSGQQTDGILYTRGDDGVGENISDKKCLISVELGDKTLPLEQVKQNLRGEILIKKSDFQIYQSKILRKDKSQYKTERSILAGLLRTKEITTQYRNFLTFIPYGVTHNYIFTKHQIALLDYKSFLEKIKNLDYPTDGLVIKLFDEEYSNSLGSTAHHPRGQIALKYGNPIAKTKLANVEWFVGKNNTLNPVGIVTPCLIAGHTITKVNLHNAKNILDLDLHINDEVLIERCGEIIPNIVKVYPTYNRTEICIAECPKCGSQIEFISPFLYCTNNYCSGVLSKKLTDSCSRIGLENIGQSTIDKLIDIGIETIVDILKLDVETIKQLDGFKDKSATNLYNEIQKVIKTPIEEYKILSCLNITGIGDTLSKDLVNTYGLSKLMNFTIEDIENIPNFGSIRADNLYLGLEDNREIIEDLLKILNIKQHNINPNIKLTKVCFTGKMPQTRSYYEELAIKHGYLPVDSVTSDLGLLVTADLSSTKGKMVKARKLGIKIVDLPSFLNSLTET